MSNEEQFSVPKPEPPPGTTYTGRKIAVHYCKSPQYRTIHVDGMYGGISPQGKTLFLGFYSERSSLPETTYVPIVKTGDDAEMIGFGADHDRVNSRPGIMREMEANIVIDIETAEQIVAWLAVRIRQVRDEQGKTKAIGLDPGAVVERPF